MGVLNAYWSTGQADVGALLIGLVALAIAHYLHANDGPPEQASDRLAKFSTLTAMVAPFVLGIGYGFGIIINWASVEANAIDWNIWIGEAVSGSYSHFRDDFPKFSGIVSLIIFYVLPAMWRVILAYALTQLYLFTLHFTLLNGISDEKFFTANGPSIGMGSALLGFIPTVAIVLVIYF